MRRLLLLCACMSVGACRKSAPPESTTSPVTSAATESGPPLDAFLDVAPDRWRARPAADTESTPAPVEKWDTIAFDIVVPSLGDLRVSIVNRVATNDPLGPAPLLQDEHHVFDAKMSVHPQRPIRLRLSFETWRGKNPTLPAWFTDLVPPDAGAGYAGAMLVTVDESVGSKAPSRVEAKALVPIGAAPLADYGRNRTAIGGSVTAKVGDGITLARWAWAPPLTAVGMLDELQPTARMLGPSGWVPPQDYPHPTWALRIDFTPAAMP